MRTLRLFEQVTIVTMAVLVVATLVGCLRYEMERVSDIESAPPPHSEICRSHIVKDGDHSSLYCPDG